MFSRICLFGFFLVNLLVLPVFSQQWSSDQPKTIQIGIENLGTKDPLEATLVVILPLQNISFARRVDMMVWPIVAGERLKGFSRYFSNFGLPQSFDFRFSSNNPTARALPRKDWNEKTFFSLQIDLIERQADGSERQVFSTLVENLTLASLPKAESLILAPDILAQLIDNSGTRPGFESTVSNHPILNRIEMFGGSDSIYGGLVPTVRRQGVEVIITPFLFGSVVEFVEVEGQQIPIVLYSKPGSSGGPPYFGRYIWKGQKVNLEGIGGSISITCALYFNGQIYVGGYVGKGNLYEAMVWVDGKPQPVFTDKRHGAVAGLGVIDGAVTIAGWHTVNGKAAPFISRLGKVETVYKSSVDIFFYSADFSNNSWRLAFTEQIGDETVLWSLGPDGKKEIFRYNGTIGLTAFHNSTSGYVYGGLLSYPKQDDLRIPFSYAKGILETYEKVLDTADYFRIDDVAMVDGRPILVGNVQIRGERGFGFHSLFFDGAMIRLPSDGFVHRIRPVAGADSAE